MPEQTMHIHSKSLWSLISGIVLVIFGIILMFSFSWLKIFDIVIGIVVLLAGILLLGLRFVEFIAAHKVKTYNTLKSFSIRKGIVEITVKSGKTFSSSLFPLRFIDEISYERKPGNRQIRNIGLFTQK